MNNNYEKVVDFIIEQIEKSQTLPWDQPWINKDTQFPMNFRGTHYRGMNLFNLSFIQMIRGYKQNIWLTFNQARTLKGFVKAGEKGVPVIFWKIQAVRNGVQHEDEGDDGDVDEQKIPFIRVYTVFNIEQCDLPEGAIKKYEIKERTFVPIEEAERIISEMPKKPAILFDTLAEAYYRPSDDSVHVPEGKHFKKEEYYYSTMFHELVHSTGHASRLNREGVIKNAAMADKATYSEEELVAELGAVFLCSQTGIEKEPAADHVAYLQNWVKYLKDHKKSLLWASQRAQKAVDFITKVPVKTQ
jgi:antirestriction protein ArdC